MIKTVCLTHTGMLMVFDEQGEQLPEYQGPLGELPSLLRHILDDCGPDTVFWAINLPKGWRSAMPRKAIEGLVRTLSVMDRLTEQVSREIHATENAELN